MTAGLHQLDMLIGEWITESKKYSKGRGHTWVAPTEDGRFLRIEAHVDDDRFPSFTQLIGADDTRDECTVLYHDSRGVYRVYHMSVTDRVWKMWRDAPQFNQRFAGRITDDGRSITGQWEISEDGKSWEVDFDLTYTRVVG